VLTLVDFLGLTVAVVTTDVHLSVSSRPFRTPIAYSLSLSLSLSLLVQKCKRDRGSYYVYMYSTVVIQVINEAFEYATHAVRLEWPETILTVTKTNDSYRRSYVWGGGTGILCYYIT
jgi:hypothetical protein